MRQVKQWLRNVAAILRDTVSAWSDDHGSRLGAALAYYSIFSIGPLMLIAISIAGLVYGERAASGELSEQLRAIFGPSGAEAAEGLLAGARERAAGHFTTGVSLAVLLFAATGVVIQLKDALNTIWCVEAKPGLNIWSFIKNYLVSIATVIGIGFLLLVSLTLSTALTYVSTYLSFYLPLPAWVLQTLNVGVTFVLVTAFFGTAFKVLPDVKIRWRDVRLGAFVTAVLFTVGKSLIALYLGRQSMTSTYGAAGSIVVFLIWVYYTAQIVFLGAEFTKVTIKRRGVKLETEAHAVPDESSADADTLLKSS